MHCASAGVIVEVAAKLPEESFASARRPGAATYSIARSASSLNKELCQGPKRSSRVSSAPLPLGRRLRCCPYYTILPCSVV